MDNVPENPDSPNPFADYPENYRAGYVAIAGKPNAGKSTFLNQVLGTKLSIISPKVQTTRHRITGIHSDERGQIVFLDTPGIIDPSYKLHVKMMDAVQRALRDADFVIFIADPADLPDEKLWSGIQKMISKRTILVINKMDLHNQPALDLAREKLESFIQPSDTFFVSALTGFGIPELINRMFELLPKSPPFFPPDQLSEHPERFFVSELIREQLFHLYRAEIPYSCTVDILSFDSEPEMDRIEAEIIVNRNSQKGIIIGKGGQALKKLGTEARKEIELFLGKKVYLSIFVKVREKWRDNDNYLRSFGYN
ncbi:MAG: GTPase Era [Balneolales bacterium]|nr:GTPase Era [Balneolales bacterium]